MSAFQDILDDMSRKQLAEYLAIAIERVIDTDSARRLADDVRNERVTIWFSEINEQFGLDDDAIVDAFCRVVKEQHGITVEPVGRVH